MDLIWNGQRLLTPGGGFHIGFVEPTPSITMTDFDGNIYPTVTIGTQIWTTQNLKSTHYSDGTSILNITPNVDGAEQITSWDNTYPTGFDLFESSGKDITHCSGQTGWYHKAVTNDIAVTVGDVLKITVNITMNSGDVPYFSILSDPYTFYQNLPITAGLNTFEYVISTTENVLLAFNQPVGNTDFSAVCSLVKEGWTGNASGAYCWYNNDILNKPIYGALYNWFALNNAHGLAPTGWRVPTGTDFDALKNYIGNVNNAAKLKETGTTHWDSPNTGATDEYGFKALPGSNRNSGGDFGVFGGLGVHGDFYQSDLAGGNAQAQILWYNSLPMGAIQGDKTFGASVRCIKI